MKLKSSKPYWLIKNGLLKSYPSLAENITCDILVIGSGITGSLISYALTDAGFDTVLIDKRDVATGSTSATTALLQYEIDIPLLNLAGIIGESAAVECFKKGIDAIGILRELIMKEKIDCEFETKHSLQVSHTKKNETDLYKEYLLRKRHGFEVHWLTSQEIDQLYLMKSHAGILSKQAASVDAYKLSHGLMNAAMKKGLRIFDKTPVKKIIDGKNPFIETENGFYVRCKRIIFCTGYETMKMFRKKQAAIHSTFACISEQNYNLYPILKDLLIWDTANPYIYMRSTPDKRLLVGGGDIPFKYRAYPDKFLQKKTDAIIKKLLKLFPDLKFKNDYSWSGAFGSTPDALPYIGTHPDFKNAIFVLGLGGNGITFSVQGIELVLKVLANQNDELLHYYRFNR